MNWTGNSYIWAVKKVIGHIWRGLRTLFLSVTLVVLLGLWGMRTSWFQAWAIPKIERVLSQQLNTEVHIGGFDLDLPAKIVLQKVVVEDQQGQNMLALGELRVNAMTFSLPDLILQPKNPEALTIRHLDLMAPQAFLYKSRRDSTFNFDFLSSSSEPKKDTEPKPFKLDLSSVRVQAGKFHYTDSTAADSVLFDTLGLNTSNLLVENFRGGFDVVMELPGHVRGRIDSLGLYEAHARQELSGLQTKFDLNFGEEVPGGLSLFLEPTRIALGQETDLQFRGSLTNQPPDSLPSSFAPQFKGQFSPSTVNFDEVNAFMAKPLPLAGPVQFEGAFFGNLDTLRSPEFKVQIGDTTRITTSLLIRDLVEPGGPRMEFGIAPSRAAFSELKALLPTVDLPLQGTVYLQGPFKMDSRSMRSRGIRVGYGQHTDLTVRMRLFNYDREEDLIMDYKVKEGKVDFAEVYRLLPGIELPPWFPNVGRGTLDGQFIGGTRDFVVKADLLSDIGEVEGNLHLVTPQGPGPIEYEGRVRTANLNVDALGAVPEFQSRYLNFNGYVNGKGTNLGEANLELTGGLANSEVMGFELDSVRTKEVVINGYEIKGAVELLDRQGNASVSVDMVAEPGGDHRYNIFGDVANLDLDHYGIIPGDSILLTTILNARIKGDSIENYTGKLRFFQIRLDRPGTDSLRLNNVVLSSNVKDDLQRDLTLKSSVATMHVDGRFRINEAITVGSRLAKEISLYILNDDSLITQYYAEKEIVPSNIAFNDTIVTKAGLNDLLDFFRVPAYVQPGTQAAFTLLHDGTDQLHLDLQSDTIRYETVGLYDNTVDFDLQKSETENNLLLTGQAASQVVEFGENIRLERLKINPEGNDRNLELFVAAQQPDLGNRYVLDIETEFFANGEIMTHIRPGPSRVNIKGDIWRFGEKNLIRRRDAKPPSQGEAAESLIQQIMVRDMKFYKEDKSILINGNISSDPADELRVIVNDFPIGEILKITEQDLGIDGVINMASITGRLLTEEVPYISGRAEIGNFRYKTIDSLDINGTLGWPFIGGKDYVGLAAKVKRENIDSLDFYGSYNLRVDSLDFSANPSSIPLRWVQPFLGEEITNLNGQISLDTLHIGGTTQKPTINGALRMKGVGARVTYLNNEFFLGNNSLVFNNETLSISRLKIFDKEGGSAVVHGNIFYPSLKDIRLNLLLDEIDDFVIMDTRKRHSSDFYGHIVLRGDSARIRGSVNNLQLGARVSTADNTWLDIPLDDYTTANGLDYVTFVAGGEEVVLVKEETDLTGIGMKVTVNATPGARVRLILDEQVGDIIEARGEGAITMEITENGEFSMSGVYELIEGNYLFTAENIVNKKFVVQPGGRIIFNGDPYNAELDLTAIYKVNADISDLLGDQSGRVPVNILMNMTGSLEEPVIRLSLQVDELRQQDVLGLASYFRRIEYDEQELNKQVVSLLLFGRFSGNTTGNANSTATGVTSSISELISNQVNYWISQAFEDANLNFEVNTNEFQDVELAIETTLFQDRVTIERNGTLISNQSQSVTLGDLSVQIKLLPLLDSATVVPADAGQLVLEIFNREDASLNAAANVTRGAGFFYKKDFDRIPDLFKRQRGEGKQEGDGN